MKLNREYFLQLSRWINEDSNKSCLRTKHFQANHCLFFWKNWSLANHLVEMQAPIIYIYIYMYTNIFFLFGFFFLTTLLNRFWRFGDSWIQWLYSYIYEVCIQGCKVCKIFTNFNECVSDVCAVIGIWLAFIIHSKHAIWDAKVEIWVWLIFFTKILFHSL